MNRQDEVTPGVVHVGVFFDGTGNNQGNAAGAQREAGDGSYGNARSNVALLHGLYPGGRVNNDLFVKLYVEGIGTTEGERDSMFAQATGRGRTGVAARVGQALEQVSEVLASYPLVPGTRVEFDLFGFSRGAAAARHMANQLLKGQAGLPRGVQCEKVINFIGLFDTVAAIVAPLRGDFDAADARFGRLKLGVRHPIARQVVQLVAGDEVRHNFPLVRSDNDIVLPGAHSDIGGGYMDTLQERVMLCKPQSNRVSAATSVEQTHAWQVANGLLNSAADGARVLTWEKPVERVRGNRDVQEKEVYAAVYREREVSGHLSRVYLSVMRELALRGGVPFAPLGDDEAHRLPDELRAISSKLHDFALGRCGQLQLTPEERLLLKAKYIHTSANWGEAKEGGGSDLDVMYVNRPGEGGRVMHDNPAG
ncbi:phospholipase effector Tle1 domain-containing protein [Pseudomonas sp. PSKL.D1]|uniref:phospholipase effector Tle1 domain-containing protein n=1 Tax=Pseudomonas sp. PSKL.D1 TaxID=3029060 RepID=UPI0023814F68|nr:DUF2235 domain-containing protein [Pseudomonas sp. PSKL.D1]WDY56472.1 DUF2235 domain-containing protein [Pseudomonas sp. PSKL.D1]